MRKNGRARLAQKVDHIVVGILKLHLPTHRNFLMLRRLVDAANLEYNTISFGNHPFRNKIVALSSMQISAVKGKQSEASFSPMFGRRVFK